MKTYPAIEITGDTRMSVPDVMPRSQEMAMRRLTSAVRRVALTTVYVNGMLWIVAMKCAGAPSAELWAAAFVMDQMRLALFTMRPERLIAEYGHLLPRIP